MKSVTCHNSYLMMKIKFDSTFLLRKKKFICLIFFFFFFLTNGQFSHLAINRLKLATLFGSAINLGKTKALDASKLPPSRIVSRSRVVPSTTMMDFASVRCRACLPPTHQDKWSLSPFFGLTEMRSKVDWSKFFLSQQKTYFIVVNLIYKWIYKRRTYHGQFQREYLNALRSWSLT